MLEKISAIKDTANIYEEIIDKIAHTIIGFFVMLTFIITVIYFNFDLPWTKSIESYLLDGNKQNPTTTTFLTISLLTLSFLIGIATDIINYTLQDIIRKFIISFLLVVNKILKYFENKYLKKNASKDLIDTLLTHLAKRFFVPNVLNDAYKDKYISSEMKEKLLKKSDTELGLNYYGKTKNNYIYKGGNEIMSLIQFKLNEKHHNHKFRSIILSGLSTLFFFYALFLTSKNLYVSSILFILSYVFNKAVLNIALDNSLNSIYKYLVNDKTDLPTNSHQS